MSKDPIDSGIKGINSNCSNGLEIIKVLFKKLLLSSTPPVNNYK